MRNTQAESIIEQDKRRKLFNRLKLRKPVEGPCEGGKYHKDGSFWLKPAFP